MYFEEYYFKYEYNMNITRPYKKRSFYNRQSSDINGEADNSDGTENPSSLSPTPSENDNDADMLNKKRSWKKKISRKQFRHHDIKLFMPGTNSTTMLKQKDISPSSTSKPEQLSKEAITESIVKSLTPTDNNVRKPFVFPENTDVSPTAKTEVNNNSPQSVGKGKHNLPAIIVETPTVRRKSADFTMSRPGQASTLNNCAARRASTDVPFNPLPDLTVTQISCTSTNAAGTPVQQQLSVSVSSVASTARNVKMPTNGYDTSCFQNLDGNGILRSRATDKDIAPDQMELFNSINSAMTSHMRLLRYYKKENVSFNSLRRICDSYRRLQKFSESPRLAWPAKQIIKDVLQQTLGDINTRIGFQHIPPHVIVNLLGNSRPSREKTDLENFLKKFLTLPSEQTSTGLASNNGQTNKRTNKRRNHTTQTGVSQQPHNNGILHVRPSDQTTAPMYPPPAYPYNAQHLQYNPNVAYHPQMNLLPPVPVYQNAIETFTNFVQPRYPTTSHQQNQALPFFPVTNNTPESQYVPSRQQNGQIMPSLPILRSQNSSAEKVVHLNMRVDKKAQATSPLERTQESQRVSGKNTSESVDRGKNAQEVTTGTEYTHKLPKLGPILPNQDTEFPQLGRVHTSPNQNQLVTSISAPEVALNLTKSSQEPRLTPQKSLTQEKPPIKDPDESDTGVNLTKPKDNGSPDYPKTAEISIQKESPQKILVESPVLLGDDENGRVQDLSLRNRLNKPKVRLPEVIVADESMQITKESGGKQIDELYPVSLKSGADQNGKKEEMEFLKLLKKLRHTIPSSKLRQLILKEMGITPKRKKIVVQNEDPIEITDSDEENRQGERVVETDKDSEPSVLVAQTNDNKVDAVQPDSKEAGSVVDRLQIETDQPINEEQDAEKDKMAETTAENENAKGLVSSNDEVKVTLAKNLYKPEVEPISPTDSEKTFAIPKVLTEQEPKINPEPVNLKRKITEPNNENCSKRKEEEDNLPTKKYCEAPKGKLCYLRESRVLFRYFEDKQVELFVKNLADQDEDFLRSIGIDPDKLKDLQNKKDMKNVNTQTEIIKLPPNVEFSIKEDLQEVEDFVRELKLVQGYVPKDFSGFYKFVTGYQIVRNKNPVALQTFLTMYNTNRLTELLAKYICKMQSYMDLDDN